MDAIKRSNALKQEYLSCIKTNSVPVKSVLFRANKYELKFQRPLHEFSTSQYQEFMQDWSRRSTYFSNQHRVSKYLEWLELKGIPTTILQFRAVRYTEAQLTSATQNLFSSMEDVEHKIFHIFFSGEGMYSSKIQEGTSLILRMLGLKDGEISILRCEDIDFERSEIHFDGKTIHEIPEGIMEMLSKCVLLEGRFVRANSSDKVVHFIDSPYLLKQIKRTEARNATFVNNMLKRAAILCKSFKNLNRVDKSFSPKDLLHSYLFCKFLKFEQEHPDQKINNLVEETRVLASDLANYWSGFNLPGPTAQRYFVEEYICWKSFNGRE